MAVVPFVNCFEVPAGQEDAFVALWQEVNSYMAAKPGYVGHRLHRSLAPDAKFRFINYAEWESSEHWQAAHDERFRQLVSPSRVVGHLLHPRPIRGRAQRPGIRTRQLPPLTTALRQPPATTP